MQNLLMVATYVLMRDAGLSQPVWKGSVCCYKRDAVPTSRLEEYDVAPRLAERRINFDIVGDSKRQQASKNSVIMPNIIASNTRTWR